MFSQLVFVFSSYLIHIFLGRLFGPEQYGLFGIVLSLMVIVQVFLQKGLPQAVSKFIAEYSEQQSAIYYSATKIQFISALVFTLLYFLSAPILASLLHDSSLIPYIRFSSLLILPVAFFSLYTDGFLNGKRVFPQQAYIRIVQSLLKLFFVFIFIFFGFAIYGAISAYIFSALVAAFIAHKFIKNNNYSNLKFSQKKILFFAIPVIISSLVYVLIKNIDLLLIKHILIENQFAGYYTSAMTLAGVTYFLFAGLSLVLLPSISKSLSEKNFIATKSYINKSLRYILILLIPITFIISATAHNLVNLFYSVKFSPAGPALSILIFGSTFLAIFVLLCSVITGSGKPKTAMLYGLILIPISIGLNYLLIPLFGISGAALATTFTAFFGALLTSIYTLKKFKTLVSFTSFFKILFASIIVYYFTIQYQFSGIALILTYFLAFLIYFSLLFTFNEIKPQDIKLIKNIIKK